MTNEEIILEFVKDNGDDVMQTLFDMSEELTRNVTRVVWTNCLEAIRKSIEDDEEYESVKEGYLLGNTVGSAYGTRFGTKIYLYTDRIIYWTIQCYNGDFNDNNFNKLQLDRDIIKHFICRLAHTFFHEIYHNVSFNEMSDIEYEAYYNIINKAGEVLDEEDKVDAAAANYIETNFDRIIDSLKAKGVI